MTDETNETQAPNGDVLLTCEIKGQVVQASMPLETFRDLLAAEEADQPLPHYARGPACGDEEPDEAYHADDSPTPVPTPASVPESDVVPVPLERRRA